MQEVINYFTSMSIELPGYVWWVHLVAIAATYLLTQAIKLPIKKFGTDKLAQIVATRKGQNDDNYLRTIRHKFNIVFIFFPFGIGVFVSYLISVIAKQYAFSWEAGLMWGGASATAYETIARIIRRVKNGETLSEKSLLTDFRKSKNEADVAQKEFMELVKKAKGN